MKIDHIGYAVKKIDKAVESFQLLGFIFGEVIDDMERNVKIVFGESEGYRIELIQPLDKQKESPVDAYLSKIGPTAYHFCYISKELGTDIDRLKKQGYRMVCKPARAEAFGGRRVVFLMNLGIGLVEIVED